jgi:hypothetical protein
MVRSAHGDPPLQAGRLSTMGLSQHLPTRPPYSKQRIPAPPAGTRFDAVFVNAVAELAAMARHSSTTTGAQRPTTR